MNKKRKQLIKKHIDIVRSMYPEVFIAVIMIGDDILVDIDSHEISDEERYEDLMINFIREYHKKGFLNVYWAVDDTLTCDNLSLLEGFIETPEKENLKQRVVNF